MEIFSKLRKKKYTEESIFFDRVKLLSHERNFVLLVQKKLSLENDVLPPWKNISLVPYEIPNGTLYFWNFVVYERLFLHSRTLVEIRILSLIVFSLSVYTFSYE